MLTVPGKKIKYRNDKDGPEVSWDNGETWHFTHRSAEEFKRMHPSAIEDAPTEDSNEDRDRELFGETLDEPIPDDLWDMIS